MIEGVSIISGVGRDHRGNNTSHRNSGQRYVELPHAANDHQPQLTPEERLDEKIREAETRKADVFPITGKTLHHANTAQIDEKYMVIGGHLDKATIQKVRNSEYVDFGKLIPKDRVLAEEDKRLEMIIKGTRAYYVPVNENTQISNFYRWEQAFRVFSNVFTKFHPQRSSKLIEYNHTIHTISQSYVWENVYMYDKDFRIHISHNPQRYWSVILQQAWSLRLKDKINVSNQGAARSSGSPSRGHNSNQDANGDKIPEPCRRYNKGRCPFGAACHFKHRCSFCFKFGHSILHCRKLQAALEQSRTFADRRGSGGGSTHQKGNKNHHGNNKASEINT